MASVDPSSEAHPILVALRAAVKWQQHPVNTMGGQEQFRQHPIAIQPIVKKSKFLKHKALYYIKGFSLK